MINFKTFESLGNPTASPESIYEPQGLLNRTASVRVWDKVGIGYTSSVERGVFAVDYIKKGECFEVAPIIVVPTPYSPPPLIIGGGGGGGGGSMGGGEARPKPSTATVAKPSFLKKNFIPLLLVTSAIFVFIKKPIK